MNNRLQGTLILATVALIVSATLIALSQRPNADKIVNEIAAIKTVQNGNFQIEAASEKILLIERFHKNFPNDPRIRTLLRDLFASSRTTNITLNDLLRMRREAHPLLKQILGESSYIHQIIELRRGQEIDEMYRADLLSIFQERNLPTQSASLLFDTVTWSGLYPDQAWKNSVFKAARELSKSDHHTEFAKTLASRLDAQFSISGIDLKSGKLISTDSFSGKKVILYLPKEKKPNTISGLIQNTPPANSTLLVVTAYTPKSLDFEKLSVPIIVLQSPVLPNVPDELDSIVFYLDSQNQLFAINDESSMYTFALFGTN